MLEGNRTTLQGMVLQFTEEKECCSLLKHRLSFLPKTGSRGRENMHGVLDSLVSIGCGNTSQNLV